MPATATRVRPTVFDINPLAPLARGAVAMYLGNAPKTWRMHDSSGRGNHGTLTLMDPATDWVFLPELGRWVLDFDATNDYVNATGVKTVTNRWTLSMWAKGGGGGAQRCPLFDSSAGRTYLSWWDLEAYKCCCYDGGWRTFSDTPPTSAWHHVSWVSNAGLQTLYVDGIQFGVAVSGTSVNIGGTVAIGSRYDGTILFSKQLGDVLIHDRLLLPSEIAALADPSNVMLEYGGVPLIGYPKRRWWVLAEEEPPVGNIVPILMANRRHWN